MKNSIVIIIAFACITGTMLTSCNTPAEKVENAENKVAEANKKLVEAREEYLDDIETFRKTTNERILTNNQHLIEFKARIKNEKMDAKLDYDRKILKLEQKNTDMKKTMDDYKADGKEKWRIFKQEFNHDMNELDKDFKNLNTKKTS